jgi:hypothetical protein
MQRGGKWHRTPQQVAWRCTGKLTAARGFCRGPQGKVRFRQRRWNSRSDNLNASVHTNEPENYMRQNVSHTGETRANVRQE